MFASKCKGCGRIKSKCACCPNCHEAICVCPCPSCQQPMDNCICCEICGKTICEHKGNAARRKNGAPLHASPAPMAPVVLSPMSQFMEPAVAAFPEPEPAIVHTPSCPAFNDSDEECIPTCPAAQIHNRRKTSRQVRADAIHAQAVALSKKHFAKRMLTAQKNFFTGLRTNLAEKKQQIAAATTLQARVRGFLTKKKFLDLRDADRERKTAALEQIELSISAIYSETQALKMTLDQLHNPTNADLHMREDAIARLQLSEKNSEFTISDAERKHYEEQLYSVRERLPTVQQYVAGNNELIALATQFRQTNTLSAPALQRLTEILAHYKQKEHFLTQNGYSIDVGIAFRQRQNCAALCKQINDFYDREVISLRTPPVSPAMMPAAASSASAAAASAAGVVIPLPPMAVAPTAKRYTNQIQLLPGIEEELKKIKTRIDTTKLSRQSKTIDTMMILDTLDTNLLELLVHKQISEQTIVLQAEQMLSGLEGLLEHALTGPLPAIVMDQFVKPFQRVLASIIRIYSKR